MTDAEDDYLAREAKARKNIDKQLVAAGWLVQKASEANVGAGVGVVIREFVLEKGHGRVDYLLFLNGQPAGVIEAKPEGTTLVEVEHQSGKYVDGLPDWITPAVYSCFALMQRPRRRPGRSRAIGRGLVDLVERR